MGEGCVCVSVSVGVGCVHVFVCVCAHACVFPISLKLCLEIEEIKNMDSKHPHCARNTASYHSNAEADGHRW